MPRSRRRHHSRSRSRSRSHSHDRDRDVKRRKVDESFDGVHNNSHPSVSSEPEATEIVAQNEDNCPLVKDTPSAPSTTTATPIPVDNVSKSENDVSEADCVVIDVDQSEKTVESDVENIPEHKNGGEVSQNVTAVKIDAELAEADGKSDQAHDTDAKNGGSPDVVTSKQELAEDEAVDVGQHSDSDLEESANVSKSSLIDEDDVDAEMSELETSTQLDVSVQSAQEPDVSHDTSTAALDTSQNIVATLTPGKALTPKQRKRQEEREKKLAARRQEKEERMRKRQEERDERRRQREAKEAEEREAKQRNKEAREAKRKEQEEVKRKEREEKEEVKRKEREEREQRRQAEIDEKERERLKAEEKKQKAAAAFTKFFVPKPTSKTPSEKTEITETTPSLTAALFMPFAIKSDMRLAPTQRRLLDDSAKTHLETSMEAQTMKTTYLKELPEKQPRSSGKTWPYEEDVAIVGEFGVGIDDVGEAPRRKLRAKFLKFTENQRPPYYGTWRKRSKSVNARNPLGRDEIFNYDVDSDEEWEDEEEGEDIAGSDGEKEDDPESSAENNDYEVDNEFFVPHGHLSDDEQNVSDGEGGGELKENITPEIRKAHEKLLKRQFDEEYKKQTRKLKPQLLGCIWYNDNEVVDEAIHKFLQPFAIIAGNGRVQVGKRPEDVVVKKPSMDAMLNDDAVRHLLRLVHGNTNPKLLLWHEFSAFAKANSINLTGLRKSSFVQYLGRIAKYQRCPLKGALYKKRCWMVQPELLKAHPDLELPIPNQWKYLTNI